MLVPAWSRPTSAPSRSSLARKSPSLTMAGHETPDDGDVASLLKSTVMPPLMTSRPPIWRKIEWCRDAADFRCRNIWRHHEAHDRWRNRHCRSSARRKSAQPGKVGLQSSFGVGFGCSSRSIRHFVQPASARPRESASNCASRVEPPGEQDGDLALPRDPEIADIPREPGTSSVGWPELVRSSEAASQASHHGSATRNSICASGASTTLPSDASK